MKCRKNTDSKNTKVVRLHNSRYIYQSGLDKVFFQHEIFYGEFKNLTRKIHSNKRLRNKPFDISKHPKYDESQRGLALMVYKFLIKKSSGSCIKNENMPKIELAEEVHKPNIKK